MKKVLVIAILLSYSIASFGVGFNYFYCCGKLKKISFVVNTEQKEQEANSKKGCCDYKTLTIKLKVDQKTTDHLFFNFAPELAPAILYTNNYTTVNTSSVITGASLYKRPPPVNLPSRNILYCVFRI